MKFFICIALISFLLGFVSAEDKVFTPLKKGLRTDPAKALAGLKSTKNLRTKGISGTTPGGYVAVDQHVAGHCMGEREASMIWKAGACVPAYDSNGDVTGHSMASCFTDSGMSEITWYGPTDTTCTGTPIADPTMGNDNTCYKIKDEGDGKGVALQCFEDLYFAKKAYAKELFQFVYTNPVAYANERLGQAVYFEMLPDMSSTVMNLADEDRAECAYLLPSYPPQCQDTRSFKSVAFVGRNFEKGTMTLYSMYGGRGPSKSFDYGPPNQQMNDGNWIAYGYFKDNWYEEHVVGPTIMPAP